ncbi:MAG: phage tail protein [Gammaproteobacteria bacterium]
MAECYLGEIRMFASNFAPHNWALCYGQLEAITNNQALFSLLGTTYGGDGRSSFGLPDMRGRVPVHVGTGPGLTTRQQGAMFGTETVNLTADQLPAHRHSWMASSSAAGQDSAAGNVVAAQTPPDVMYEAAVEISALTKAPDEAVTSAGSGQSHLNVMPVLGLNFIIALQGIYPSRN